MRMKETMRLHFHFSLSFIGEGNGNPLQGSCLENPRDEGAWWAAVCGVAQSRTRLKRLSSSSSSSSSKYGKPSCPSARHVPPTLCFSLAQLGVLRTFISIHEDLMSWFLCWTVRSRGQGLVCLQSVVSSQPGTGHVAGTHYLLADDW